MHRILKPSPSADGVLSGGGEMGKLIRTMDWSKTPLGPIETWPQSLRTTVSLCLASNFPISIAWGPQRTQIYNDGYWPICGAKHPHSMGQDFRECWFSAWDAIGEAFDRATAGETTFLVNQRMFLDRNGYLEETFFTFSFSPIRDETGGVGGLFHPVTEMTQQTLAERRLKVMRAVGECATDAKTVEAACQLIGNTMRAHALDLPFALLYLVDSNGRRARLAGSAGLTPGTAASPLTVDLQEEDPAGWPLTAAIRSGAALQVDDLVGRFGPLDSGPYLESPHTALVLPLVVPGLAHPLGILAAGVSPRRVLDEPYRTFYDLLGATVTNALNNARTSEEERKRAEALAELDRAKTAFFSNVSHEFRTPLTLMLGPLEDALAAAGGLPPREREYIEIAHRNGLRLLKLVNSLLDFARIEAGRIEAVYEPTDLAAFTADLASNFRSAIERAGLRLVVDCPPLPEPMYVDREMWEKVVLNLLSNAFKFTFEGEVGVQLRWMGDAAVLSVSDTGVGIPADELPNLFTRFHRIRGAQARTHEGTGIGLALVHELAKLHGGSIGVSSEPGRGSTFNLRIPAGSAHLPADRLGAGRALQSTSLGAVHYVSEALRWLPEELEESDDAPAASTPEHAAAAVAPASAGPQPPQPAQAARPARILVADDNADMRDYVRRLLANQNWAVETVPDGATALARARERLPDLVLTDVMMPGLDGFDLLRALRADPATRTVPVILLSARAGEEARIDGLEAGADDYVVKPFSAQELVARLGAQLEMARLRRELVEQVQAQAERLRLIADALPALIAYVDDQHRYQFNNQAYWHWFGQDPAQLRGQHLRDVLGEEAYRLLRPKFEAALGGEQVVFEAEVPYRHGGLRAVEANYVPHHAGDGRVLGFYSLVTDISERRRAEAFHAGQRQVLEQVAQGKPLPDVLAGLCRLVEAHSNSGALASVLLVSDDTAHLRHGAAPSLPAAYSQAIDGIEIGPAVGSCGTAVYRGERVVVTDIATDPLWADFRGLALAHGLRSCWATPIRDGDGRVVGSFAVYGRTAGPPSPRDQEVVALVTRIAALAIERERAARALHEREAQLQTLFDAAPVGVYLVDADFRIRALNPTARAAFGDRPDLVGRELAEVIHTIWPPAYADEVISIFRRTLETGEPYLAPERVVRRRDSGVTEYAEWRVNRVPLPDGRLGVVCYFRDISAQVFARQAIAESEARLAAELADARLLQRISTQLIEHHKTDGLYGQILEAAIELMRADKGSLQRLHPDCHELRLLAQKGFDPASAAFWEVVASDSGTVSGAALRSRRRVIVPEVESAAFIAGTEDLAHFRRSRIRAVQSTPLVTRGGQLVGVISTHWAAPHQPPERHLQLLDVLARQAADLLERRQAEDAVAADLRDTQLLRDLSARLVSESDRQVFYHEILAAAITLTQADAGAVQIYEAGAQELVLLATHGFQPSLSAAVERIGAGADTPYGLALATGQRTFMDFEGRGAADPASLLGRHAAAGFRSVQSTPLVSRLGHSIGVLSTHWCRHRRPAERELRFLDLLARQAADLIEGKRAEAALAQHASQLEERVAERTAELRRLSAHLEQVREDERTRVAREIHDELGQQLTGLKLDAASLQNKLGRDQADLRARLVEMAQAIDGTIETVRRLASELRPSILDDFGLVAAMEAQLGELQRRAGLEFSLNASLDEDRLSDDRRTALFRIFQETLTNVARHARATRVDVCLEDGGSDLVLEVRDNGRGIADHEQTATKSLGLLGMRERVRLMSGELSLQGVPGRGTTVRVKVPL